MTTTDQLLVWLAAFAASGVLQDTKVSRPLRSLLWARRHNVVACISGRADVLGREIYVRVGVPQEFPDELPFVQLSAADGDLSRMVTAHLEGDGNICFTPTREMVFDPALPIDLLAEVLDAALSTLARSWTAPDNAELLDEFASYWSHAQTARTPLPLLPLYATPDAHLRELSAWRRADLQRCDPQGRPEPVKPGTASRDPSVIAVADDPKSPNDFNGQRRQPWGRPSLTALYIPLVASTTLLPPTKDRPWTVAHLREVIRSHLTAPDLAHLDALLASRRASRDLIILGIPRPSGGGTGQYAVVAARLSGMKGGHALLAASPLFGVRLELQSVERRDRPFVMQRGGSNDQLSHRRVLVLGCGALGGHLAVMLAGAGIGHLTVVDRDTFSHDNAFRHVLGRRFVGERKVKGMDIALRERYPYLEVTAHHGSTVPLVTGGTLDVGNFDLIIDATGNATHHLSVARLLDGLPEHPPVVVAWLDVLGLGGHVATVFHDQAGCPRCFYSDPHMPLFNTASFSAPGQELGRDALGCGSYFTPFSDLDAIRTAELATRQAVAVLTGRATRSVAQSWKGDPQAFLAAGHHLSARFHKVRRRHLRDGVSYASPHCPRCGVRL